MGRSLSQKTIVAILQVICLSTLVIAQSGRVRAPDNSSGQSQPGVEEVLLPINARYPPGYPNRPVTNADLVITENGKMQKITSVRQTPSSILILINTSGYVGDPKNTQINRDIATRIVKSLRPEDQAAIVAYGDDVALVCPWTSDKIQLKQALDLNFKTTFKANFYEGLIYSTDKVLLQATGRRRMILLTDGVDNFPNHVNEEAIAAIQRARASVYIVSPNRAVMSEVNDLTKETGAWYHRIDPQARQINKQLKEYYQALDQAEKNLKTMIEETDGTILNPDTWSGMKGISEKILSEMESEYLIAYSAERKSDNQGFYPIHLSATRPEIKVKVQRGVYVKLPN
jgi:VWFA-related protein